MNDRFVLLSFFSFRLLLLHIFTYCSVERGLRAIEVLTFRTEWERYSYPWKLLYWQEKARSSPYEPSQVQYVSFTTQLGPGCCFKTVLLQYIIPAARCNDLTSTANNLSASRADAQPEDLRAGRYNIRIQVVNSHNFHAYSHANLLSIY